MRALHARVFSFTLGLVDPPRTSYYSIVVISGGLGSTGCEVPSLVLVVTEFRELGIQLKPT